jgi:hypothetical protein
MPIERCTGCLWVTLILPVNSSVSSNLCVVSRCYFPEKSPHLVLKKNCLLYFNTGCYVRIVNMRSEASMLNIKELNINKKSI